MKNLSENKKNLLYFYLTILTSPYKNTKYSYNEESTFRNKFHLLKYMIKVFIFNHFQNRLRKKIFMIYQ